MWPINRLIQVTKEELAKAEPPFRLMCEAGVIDNRLIESLEHLRRRHSCLVDARDYILNLKTELIVSGSQDIPLLAIHGLIEENEISIRKVGREYHNVYKGGMMVDYSRVLHGILLQARRHKRLMETREYILGLASSASSQGS